MSPQEIAREIVKALHLEHIDETGSITESGEQLIADALAASAAKVETKDAKVAEARKHIRGSCRCNPWTHVGDCLDHIDDLTAKLELVREALQRLYDETADYIRINHLGDVHHNVSMQMARDALKFASPEARATGEGT